MPAFLCKKIPRPMPNVIKLSKTGAHKKYPPQKVELGIFCFGKSCLLRGQDNDLFLVNGVGVYKTVGVALEDGLVLHQTGIFTLFKHATNWKMSDRFQESINCLIKCRWVLVCNKMIPLNDG